MTEIATHVQIAGIAIAAIGNAVMFFTEHIEAFTIGSQITHAGVLVFIIGVVMA